MACFASSSPRNVISRAWSEEEFQRVEDLSNDRPRKVLGYRTPREVYNTVAAQECTAAECTAA